MKIVYRKDPTQMYYVILQYANQGEKPVTQFVRVVADNEEKAIEMFKTTFYSNSTDEEWEYFKKDIQFLDSEVVKQNPMLSSHSKLELIGV